MAAPGCAVKCELYRNLNVLWLTAVNSYDTNKKEGYDKKIGVGSIYYVCMRVCGRLSQMDFGLGF